MFVISASSAKDFKIEFLKLNHPGGSVGYSIIVDEIKFTLLLDNEYDTSQFSSLQEFVNDSNLVVWDGMFTKEELITKGIWGHSSIEQGIDFFNKCNIKNTFSIIIISLYTHRIGGYIIFNSIPIC